LNTIPGIGAVASPTRPPNDFLGHESECSDVLRPLLMELLDITESIGWSRRTGASTLIFLAAREISDTGSSGDRKV
jgi:hypothetical protein